MNSLFRYKVWAEKSKFSALLETDDDEVDCRSDNEDEEEEEENEEIKETKETKETGDNKDTSVDEENNAKEVEETS